MFNDNTVSRFVPRTLAAMLVVMACLAMATNVQAGIVWSDLVAYWELDGNLTDSVGSNDGTYSSGTPVFAAGFDGTAGSALDFAGTTSFVSTAFTPGTGAKSLSLFFSTNSGTPLQIIAGSSGSNQRFYAGAHATNNPGSVQLGLGDGSLSPSAFAMPSTGFTPVGTDVSTDGSVYHHIVMVDDGAGSARMWYRSSLDSVHSYYDVTAYGTAGGGGVFSIGGVDASGGCPASGLVDDVAMFNRVLTQAEVESIYAAGSVASAIPEPSTGALLLIGSLLVLGWRRLR